MRIFVSFCLVLIALTHCDLKDRYPKPGHFCELMVREPSCVDVDFRNAKVTFQNTEISMIMIFRVQFKFTHNMINYQLDVLGEHRIQIVNLSQGSNEKRIYHRQKKK
ncbi:MAG: hypothetical protein SFU98_14905 [Leptospiraceae bacterium]|nr:hypothetical protein [Leptospiraceae bacterium]